MAFYNDTFYTDAFTIKSIFGESEANFDHDKQNYQWNLKTDKGIEFEIYDWKEGKITSFDKVFWHIGANSRKDSAEALKYIINKLLK